MLDLEVIEAQVLADIRRAQSGERLVGDGLACTCDCGCCE